LLDFLVRFTAPVLIWRRDDSCGAPRRLAAAQLRVPGLA
jgi:hypothetical protein